jgi:tetratricopeptide (TPR) repeat protein
MSSQEDWGKVKPLIEMILRSSGMRVLSPRDKIRLVAALMRLGDAQALASIASAEKGLVSTESTANPYSLGDVAKQAIEGCVLAGCTSDALRLAGLLIQAASKGRVLTTRGKPVQVMGAFVARAIESVPIVERMDFIALLERPLDKLNALSDLVAAQVKTGDAKGARATLTEAEKVFAHAEIKTEADKTLLRVALGDVQAVAGDLDNAFKVFNVSLDKTTLRGDDDEVFVRFAGNLGVALALARRTEEANTVLKWLIAPTGVTTSLSFEAYRSLVFVALGCRATPAHINGARSRDATWLPERTIDVILRAEQNSLAWDYCKTLESRDALGNYIGAISEADRVYEYLANALAPRNVFKPTDITKIMTLSPVRRVKILARTLMTSVERYVAFLPEADRPFGWLAIATEKAKRGDAAGAKQAIALAANWKAKPPSRSQTLYQIAEAEVWARLKDFPTMHNALTGVEANQNLPALIRLLTIASGKEL